MRVLLLHNFYRQPGGEDLVMADEGRLLESRGHDVVRHTVHNDDVAALSSLSLAQRTVWNHEAHRTVGRLVADLRPDVVHVHNTLPLLSPSVYYAARAHGVPVVQTLHNYRLMCPAAVFYRDGRVCTDCLGRAVPWPAVRHACYRGSRAATAAVAAMTVTHKVLRTWRRRVNLFIVPTESGRRMFIEAGLPADRLVVKPHFVDPDPGVGDGEGGFALFVGRLSAEKGVRTLLDAWRGAGPGLPLRIVGDGPMAGDVEAAAREGAVTWLRRRDREEIFALLRSASCLVFPSDCYETFGRAIAEAFAAGTPVVAAGHGAPAELVEHEMTGLHFRPGDAADLARQVDALTRDAARVSRMRAAARRVFEARYTAETNYHQLLGIYRSAMSGSRGEAVAAVSAI